MVSSTTLVQDASASERVKPSYGLGSERTQTLVTSLLLVLGTLLLYQSALRNGFVDYDDPTYVTANSHVLLGLSRQNVWWAFTSIVAAHWHPLTMLSHMLDVQLFGLNPAGHHLDSVVLHALNVVLVFLFFRTATGQIARSAVVAGLFAVLPLNVEAVAWIADRKAPLSMAFLLLALLAYLSYAGRPAVWRYVLLMVCFVCGLMSEAILITLPCVLLLVDYWPLQRFTRTDAEIASGPWTPKGFYRLALEKLPLVPFSVASGILAVHAARIGGGGTSFAMFPLSLRIKNTIYSYAVYLEKGLWPRNLAAFYPHPGRTLAMWKVLVALGFLFIITAAVVRFRENKYLAFGWFWFLGTMIPVSGLGQNGLQGMADRYAYVPFVGLFVMAVWGLADLARRHSAILPATAAGAAILAYACVAYIQIGYWRNSYTLFSHAAQVTSRNGVAEDNLGMILESAGQTDFALLHYQAASSYMPTWSTPHFHYGRALQARNRLAEAADQYESALSYENNPAEAVEVLNNLGTIYAQTNRLSDALATFDSALRIYPEDALTSLNRGIVESELRRLPEAQADISKAIQIHPTAPAYFWLGDVLELGGDATGAEREYSAALQLDPGLADASSRLNALRSEHH